MGINYLVFLEGFKCTKRAFGNVARLVVTQVALYCRITLRLIHRHMAFNEIHPVSVYDSVVSAPNSEVVGDEFNGAFGRGCHPRLSWASSEHLSVLLLS